MTKEKKNDLFEAILALGDIWGKSDKVEMLDRIWNLHLLSSEDPRYRDAYGDAVQHLRNNDDWDDEYTFLSRFGLLNAKDDVFYRFLNEVVSTKVRRSKDEILIYVNSINDKLVTEHISYELKREDDGLPVYEINNEPQEELRPIDIPKNQVSFYVDKTPVEFPALSLSSDSWDDYSRKTLFKLSYVEAPGVNGQTIGIVKIMHPEHFKTSEVIPGVFEELSCDYCSVGQNESYYKMIKQRFPTQYKSILFALRDASYFSTIADKYEHTISFQSSLLRYDEAQRAFRNARSILEERDLNNRYNFTLYARIPYYDGVAPVKFQFGNLDDSGNLDRVKALIGENGAGKSSILYSLAKALHDEDDNMFDGEQRPNFSKVIAISYSIFDNIFRLSMKSSFNFVYCGLRNRDNELLSEKDKTARFRLSIKEIVYKKRVIGYYETLKEVIEEHLLEDVFLENGKISTTALLALINKMSSGQAMITSVITEIFAHIRDNSLILFDEPEVHLHANAITKLMCIIFKICNMFKSACVVATHSAVILQELLARNVTVVEQCRDTKEPRIRGMNTETLGENLTVITEDVFGRASMDKYYGLVIQELIRNGKNYEEIENLLKSEGLPMSLNLYMYIRRQLELYKDDQL